MDGEEVLSGLLSVFFRCVLEFADLLYPRHYQRNYDETDARAGYCYCGSFSDTTAGNLADQVCSNSAETVCGHISELLDESEKAPCAALKLIGNICPDKIIQAVVCEWQCSEKQESECTDNIRILADGEQGHSHA